MRSRSELSLSLGEIIEVDDLVVLPIDDEEFFEVDFPIKFVEWREFDQLPRT